MGFGNVTNNNTWAGTAFDTVTLSLSAGSIVLIVTHQAHATIIETDASVTSNNLTFVPRSSHSRTDSGAFDTTRQEMEVWEAPVGSNLTNEVIKVTSSGIPTCATIVAIEYQGLPNTASPWDPNLSLPAIADGNGVATVSGISIDATSSKGFLFVGSADSAPAIDTVGFSPVGGANPSNGAGGQVSEIRVWAADFSAPQSGLSWGASTSSNSWMLIADALDLVLPPIKPPAGSLALVGDAPSQSTNIILQPNTAYA